MSLPSPDTPRPPAPGLPWTRTKRVAFRFATAYWLLFTLPFPIAMFAPWTDAFWMWASEKQRGIGAWFGQSILGIDGKLGVKFNGSGDRATDYLYVLLSLLVACVIAGVWTALDRRRPDYRRAAQWLVILVRYYLAYMMFAYGFAKVFRSQFPDPSLGTLIQTYGDSSPMHLLWTFMGASPTYTVFTGAVEVLAGALLLSRRTSTLGALVTVGIMANIFVLNLSYDVPVKLFSFHLLAFASLLLLPDARRLANALVLGRAAAAPAPGWRPQSVRWRRIAIAVKVLVIGIMLYDSMYRTYERSLERTGTPPLYGLYDVESFSRDGVNAPPLLTDAKRWRTASATRWKTFVTTFMDGSTKRYRIAYDEATQTMTLTEWGEDEETKHTLSAIPGDDGTLHIVGKLAGEQLDVLLRERDPAQFLLKRRGFNWINEYPYNR